MSRFVYYLYACMLLSAGSSFSFRSQRLRAFVSFGTRYYFCCTESVREPARLFGPVLSVAKKTVSSCCWPLVSLKKCPPGSLPSFIYHRGWTVSSGKKECVENKIDIPDRLIHNFGALKSIDERF